MSIGMAVVILVVVIWIAVDGIQRHMTTLARRQEEREEEREERALEREREAKLREMDEAWEQNRRAGYEEDIQHHIQHEDCWPWVLCGTWERETAEGKTRVKRFLADVETYRRSGVVPPVPEWWLGWEHAP
jgi:hypothetical protein